MYSAYNNESMTINDIIKTLPICSILPIPQNRYQHSSVVVWHVGCCKNSSICVFDLFNQRCWLHAVTCMNRPPLNLTISCICYSFQFCCISNIEHYLANLVLCQTQQDTISFILLIRSCMQDKRRSILDITWQTVSVCRVHMSRQTRLCKCKQRLSEAEFILLLGEVHSGLSGWHIPTKPMKKPSK